MQAKQLTVRPQNERAQPQASESQGVGCPLGCMV